MGLQVGRPDTKTCPECGVEFSVEYKQGRPRTYCSPRCKKRHANRKGYVGTIKHCLNCLHEFTANANAQVYCPDCQDIKINRNRCSNLTCGKDITNRKNKRDQFCSLECLNEAYPPEAWKPCQHCGEPMRPRYSHHTGTTAGNVARPAYRIPIKFCNRECWTAHRRAQFKMKEWEKSGKLIQKVIHDTYEATGVLRKIETVERELLSIQNVWPEYSLEKLAEVVTIKGIDREIAKAKPRRRTKTRNH